MNFYTAELVAVNGKETASLFKWDSMDEARKRLHGQMNYYIGFDGCEKVAITILSEDLMECRREVWIPAEPGEETKENNA
ncbi:MAG: hypothetical protein Q4A40_02325 [Bacillota bacterium]|nr:hypothetical protein [Bacillota bacterium]